jgi:hypothetical protein
MWASGVSALERGREEHKLSATLSHSAGRASARTLALLLAIEPAPGNVRLISPE